MNRTLVWLAAFVAQSALIPAQGLQRDQAPTLAGTASIRGRVVASDTGAPIRDNPVTLTALQQTASSATRTDGDGQFQFTALAAGRYRLQVALGPTSVRYLPEEQIVEVADKQTVDRIDIKLRRAGAISGRVHNEHGDGFAMARIRVFRVEAGRQQEFGSRGGFGSLTLTDDEGRFRVFALAPGEYVIAADPLGAQPQAGDAAVANRQLLTYYPGTANATEATPIKVASGDEIGGIELSIVRGGTFRISGTVVDSRGQPAVSTWVSVLARYGPSGFAGSGVKTAADGTFTARNIVAGEYFLLVRPALTPREIPADAEFATQPIQVQGDVEGLLLTTRRGATIAGTVTFDAASGTPPARPTAAAIAVDQLPRPTGLPPSSTIADEGAFRLSHVFGPVLLRVNGAAGWSLERVTVDGKDITDVPTDFGSGMSGVTIVMTKQGATLSGVVLDADGKPTREASVLVFGEAPSAWHLRYSTTRNVTPEPDGRFTLTAIRPGTYFAIALRRDDMLSDATGSFRSVTPADFERLVKLATRVELRNGATRTVDLKVTPLPR